MFACSPQTIRDWMFENDNGKTFVLVINIWTDMDNVQNIGTRKKNVLKVASAKNNLITTTLESDQNGHFVIIIIISKWLNNVRKYTKQSLMESNINDTKHLMVFILIKIWENGIYSS